MLIIMGSALIQDRAQVPSPADQRPVGDLGPGCPKELGINEGTLGNWVSAYRREHAGEEPPLTVNERARLRELERETRELKMENDFLKKAAAYFAKDHR